MDHDFGPHQPVDWANFERSLRRREVNGRVEIYVKCPQLCHGFGTCSYCHGKLGYWRRPKPRYTPFGMR